jgi:hypothetical protein
MDATIRISVERTDVTEDAPFPKSTMCPLHIPVSISTKLTKVTVELCLPKGVVLASPIQYRRPENPLEPLFWNLEIEDPKP